MPPRTVLVTGASSGLGAALVTEFAAAGWDVVAASRRGATLTSAANVRSRNVDVRDAGEMERLVGDVVCESGRLDVLVANAGIHISAPFEETPDSAARDTFETNFWGVVNSIRPALAPMRAQGSGTIVVIGSLAGAVGPPGGSFYAASKHALEGLTESLQHEVAGFGVRIVLVEPGFIKTDIARAGAARFSAAASPAYDGVRARVDARWRDSIEGGMPAEKAARAIVRAVERPGVFRLRLGLDGAWVPTLKRIVPEQIFFAFVRRAFGMPMRTRASARKRRSNRPD